MSRSDDERPAVEFVDSGAVAAPVDTGDELSTAPARRGARWYLALSGAVLVGIALIAGRGSGTHHGGATTTGPSSEVTPVAEASSDPAQCPGPTACVATASVPVAAVTALIYAFPAAHLGPVSTVQLKTGGLWFREINATAGVLDILIRIERPAVGTPVLQSGRDAGVTFVREIRDGFLVQIRVEGQRNRLPSITTLYGLADNGGLLDPG